MSTARGAAAVAVAAMLLAGCGGMTGDGTDAPMPGGQGSSSSRPVAPAVVPSTETNIPVRVMFTGLVRDGVEAGCVVLTSDEGRTYLLLDADRTVAVAGARVRVVGKLMPGLISTCQQGDPVQVISVVPIGHGTRPPPS